MSDQSSDAPVDAPIDGGATAPPTAPLRRATEMPPPFGGEPPYYEVERVGPQIAVAAPRSGSQRGGRSRLRVPPPRVLRIMHWNLQDLGGGPSRGPARSDAVIARIAAVIAECAPDICVLLEVKLGSFPPRKPIEPRRAARRSARRAPDPEREAEERRRFEERWRQYQARLARYEEATEAYREAVRQAEEEGTSLGRRELNRIAEQLDGYALRHTEFTRGEAYGVLVFEERVRFLDGEILEVEEWPETYRRPAILRFEAKERRTRIPPIVAFHAPAPGHGAAVHERVRALHTLEEGHVLCADTNLDIHGAKADDAEDSLLASMATGHSSPSGPAPGPTTLRAKVPKGTSRDIDAWGASGYDQLEGRFGRREEGIPEELDVHTYPLPERCLPSRMRERMRGLRLPDEVGDRVDAEHTADDPDPARAEEVLRNARLLSDHVPLVRDYAYYSLHRWRLRPPASDVEMSESEMSESESEGEDEEYATRDADFDPLPEVEEWLVNGWLLGRAQPLEVRDVPGDGDCFFHALAALTPGADAAGLRADAARDPRLAHLEAAGTWVGIDDLPPLGEWLDAPLVVHLVQYGWSAVVPVHYGPPGGDARHVLLEVDDNGDGHFSPLRPGRPPPFVEGTPGPKVKRARRR